MKVLERFLGIEPFISIRRAPMRFLSGIAVIAAGVVLLAFLLAERNFGLFLGIQAGWQGAGAVILMRRLERHG